MPLQDGTWDFPGDAVAGKGLILPSGGNHVVFLAPPVTREPGRAPPRLSLLQLVVLCIFSLLYGINNASSLVWVGTDVLYSPPLVCRKALAF